MPRAVRSRAGLTARAALAAGIALVAAAGGAAHAQRVVAIAPLSTLGDEDTSAAIKQATAELERATAAVAGTKVVASAQVADAIKRAKKAHLKACEHDLACLAELGKLVGAQVVIAGEVGGLGDAKVIYLRATDVASSRELRSTTLTVGGKDPAAARGAVIQLLEPGQYLGTLRFAIDVKGASVFVNGSKIALSAAGEAALPVGAQAVRVTHPEYHDFVRFMTVEFGKTTEVAVEMTQYPIVRRDVAGKPGTRDTIVYRDPPRWRRWYVVGPAAVGLAVLTGVIVGKLTSDLGDVNCHKIGASSC